VLIVTVEEDQSNEAQLEVHYFKTLGGIQYVNVGREMMAEQ
jgi:hypothetical protein